MRQAHIVIAMISLMSVMARADVRDPRLPEYLEGIAATPAGGALVIGRGSPALYEVTTSGTREVEHPDVGELVSLGDASWILGTTGLLHHDGARWVRIELPALPDERDVVRSANVTAFEDGTALVTRYYGKDQTTHRGAPGGTRLDRVEASGRTSELITLPEIILDRPASDGADGFWMVVRKRGWVQNDGYAGFARYRAGVWTLWRDPLPSSAYIAELAPMEVRDAAVEALLDALYPSPDGGATAHSYGALYRIAPDGALTAAGRPGVEKICAMVATPAGHVIISTQDASRIFLTTVTTTGAASAPRELVLPAWYRSAHFRPSVYDCHASRAPDRLWIASGAFVFEVQPTGAFTLRASAIALDRMDRANAARRPGLAAVTGPPLVALGVGTLVGASAGDRGRGVALGQSFAGSVAGLPAALLLDVLAGSPCVTGNDSGYQLYNDVACVARGGGYLVAIGAAGALGGLGAYLTGNQLDDQPASRTAYAGAFAGASIGAIASIGATKLMRRWVPAAGRWSRSILAASLIGAGSTIGYQLAR